MKRDMTKLENIIEEDLNDVNKINNAPEIDEKPPGDMPQQALDDTRRVKVISPGVLVAKRFFRNKLAIVGLSLLIFMFAFCFIGGWIIPYNQKEVFNKYDFIPFDYATAIERVAYDNYEVAGTREVHYSVRHRMNTYISEMKTTSATIKVVNDTTTEENEYTIRELTDEIYSLNYQDVESIGTYQNQVFFAGYDTSTEVLTTEEIIPDPTQFKNLVASSIPAPMTFTYLGDTYLIRKGSTKMGYNVYKVLADGTFAYNLDPLSAAFEVALKTNINNTSFTFEGHDYLLESDGLGTFSIMEDFGEVAALYSSTLVFDKYVVEDEITTAFKTATFQAIGSSTNPFVYDTKTYSYATNEHGKLVISDISGYEPVEYARLNNFAVRRYNGEDSISIDFKDKLYDAIQEFVALRAAAPAVSRPSVFDFVYYSVLLDEEGNEQVDGDGNPIFGEALYELSLGASQTSQNYLLRNIQEKYLIDIYGAPSSEHLLGTDGNGMDVLTRIMYGGRISLIIGFVVIILALTIGVILGGIAGYFGKWVDNLIMRLVDIFNCIPTMPILLILGALFDSLRLDPYTRIMYLMVILGVLGWSGIARLVRGQILSLREQEFMIAAEATGLKASRRIFRHLVPNVMPQLIVNATMGLGGIILTESTLSFLGLGAKYPLATWGAMINAVSSAGAMVAYTYIWIPVGLLICLTVIAFNFVGDGLRDAFDPKMKR